MTSILFCTPAYGGMVHAAHFRSCLNLKEELTKAGVTHDWLINTNESLVQRARNSMTAAFLQTEHTHLFWIDADIEFEAQSVAALWNLDADISCGLYSMKRPDMPLSAWRGDKLVKLQDCPLTTFEVDYAGTGFLLVKRSVFEKMRAQWPERSHEEGNVGASFAWFHPRVEGGAYLSEDYAFCRDARSLGYKVIADPTITLRHWGQYAFGQ